MSWISGYSATVRLKGKKFFFFTSGFLECVGEKVPSEEELLVTLRNAVANSARKRYHGDKGIEVLSPEGKNKNHSLAHSCCCWLTFFFFL